MFERTFENIDAVLYKDAGCNSELDYAEPTFWLLKPNNSRGGAENAERKRI